MSCISLQSSANCDGAVRKALPEKLAQKPAEKSPPAADESWLKPGKATRLPLASSGAFGWQESAARSNGIGCVGIRFSRSVAIQNAIRGRVKIVAVCLHIQHV